MTTKKKPARVSRSRAGASGRKKIDAAKKAEVCVSIINDGTKSCALQMKAARWLRDYIAGGRSLTKEEAIEHLNANPHLLGAIVDQYHAKLRARALRKKPEGRVVELKTWPEYFEEVLAERKTFEIRKNDRGFKVGDVLRLREWVSTGAGRYTGREVFREVTYLTEFAQQFGFVVLAIRPLASIGITKGGRK